MANLFRSSPARSSPSRSSPTSITPRVVVPTRSPLVQRGQSITSPPGTPTPSQRYVGDFMRRPISASDYKSKEPLRLDRIFDELKAVLSDVSSLLSFEWKETKCQGKFVPVPYPLDPMTGYLVDPHELPRFLQKNDWERPKCLCSLRGTGERTTVLLTPKRTDSVVYGEMCLVCPESECPYFVNLSKLVREQEENLLAVHRVHLIADNRGYSDPSTASARKRKLNVRVPTWKIVASGVEPPKPPSSSSKMQSEASSAEVVSTISELLRPEGIPRSKFDNLFLLCNDCERVMPKVGQANHKCMFDVQSTDSEFEEDVIGLVEE